MEFLKVSSKSSPASVAGAIAGMVKDGVPVNMQCVGAGADALHVDGEMCIRDSIQRICIAVIANRVDIARRDCVHIRKVWHPALKHILTPLWRL